MKPNFCFQKESFLNFMQRTEPYNQLFIHKINSKNVFGKNLNLFNLYLELNIYEIGIFDFAFVTFVMKMRQNSHILRITI